MRSLLIISAVAYAAIAASPALAYEGAKSPAAAAAAAAAAAEAAPTHEMCKSVMGGKMDATHPHDHARDKGGAPTWPNGKPLSKSEMDKMHAQCAAKMSKSAPAK